MNKRMVNRRFLALLSFVVLLAVCPVSAGVTATLVTAGASDNSVTVAPGGTLSVDVRLDIEGVSIVAAQMYLIASSANIFDVVSGSYNSEEWYTGGFSLTITPMGVDPVSPRDFGSLPLEETIGPGTTILATLNLAVDSAAATGTYTLNVTNIAVGDAQGANVPSVAGPDYNVIVSSGGTTPPDDGGGTTPPDDGGGTTPPDDGGGTTPPDDGGGTTPPDDGGDGTSPPDDGGVTPVVSRCGAGLVESLVLSSTALFMVRRRVRR